MVNINLEADDVNILLRSIKHCLNTCHDGGMEQGCPDCSRLEAVMAKLQAEVGK